MPKNIVPKWLNSCHDKIMSSASLNIITPTGGMKSSQIDKSPLQKALVKPILQCSFEETENKPKQ
jgi:hypothetical protein